MYTSKQAAALVLAALGVNLIDWKEVNREMYFVDTTTGKANFNGGIDKPSAPGRLDGFLNTTFNDVVVNPDGSVSLHWTIDYTLKGEKRAKFKMVSTLALIDGKIERRNYNELFDVLIARNETLNASAIADARSRYGMASDTVADVIHEMATMRHTFVFDPFQFNGEDLKIVLSMEKSTNGRARISARLLKYGIEIEPEKIRFEVWPGEAPHGLANTVQNRNPSAQFPTGKKSFEITTDLRDRQAWPIMGAGTIRVVCLAHTREDDGDIVTLLESATFDANAYGLGSFNYFGL